MLVAFAVVPVVVVVVLVVAFIHICLNALCNFDAGSTVMTSTPQHSKTETAAAQQGR